MNLKSTLFVVALALTAMAANGQNGLFIYPVEGNAAVQTPIEEVRKLTFGENGLVLHKVDGNSRTFAFGDIRKLTFEDVGTAILAPSVAGLDVNVYPRDGRFTVESAEALGQVRVFGLTGVQMFSVATNAAQVAIPTDNYPAGVYLVRVESAKGAVTKKFIVK
ncbi:MAG: T9SS type A sorting domain-containing protein [Dysgonamonadaceae bacterium]|jgi:hypothetical protein|nr:T9SS type A sorting domain-containing protein [Dysgonamonadaceae bacterium]